MRKNQVEVIGFRESIDRDSATGWGLLHLAIIFAEMERRRGRGRTLAGLEMVKTTGNGWIC